MRLFYSALLLLITTVCQAQHQYNVEYITTENGLPSDGVQGIEIDEKMGFLWIATESGLVRYNGHQFTLFNSDNFAYIQSNKIFPLAKNIDGRIYGVTHKAMYVIDQNKPIRLKDDGIHKKDLINVFVEDGPLKRDIPGVIDLDHFLPLNRNLCYIQAADTLWEYRSGMHQKKKVMPLTKSYYTFLSNKTLLACDNSDHFYRVDTAEKQLIPVQVTHTNPTPEWEIAGKKHMYWQAGMKSMIVLSGTNAWEVTYENDKIVTHLICTEVPQNSNIKHVKYWKEAEILFLGTASKGIIIVRKNQLVNVKKNKSGFDEPNAFYSQILLPDGNILINTGDILGLQPSTNTTLPINGRFNNNIFLNSDSLLWYSFDDSLYYYDYKHKTRTFLCPLPGSYVIGYAESMGKTYMANYRGIYTISPKGVDTQKMYSGLSDPYAMVELNPGRLAMATGKGVFFYNIRTRAIDTIMLTSASVRCLWKYRDYLFIGTYGDGIYVYKNGVIKKIPLDNNRYLAFTHCFVLDAQGYCWMSTNRGLFKARLGDLTSAYEQETEYVYYHFFGRNEGMDITEMNGGCTPCAIWLANNMISFPTMDGAVWVDPTLPLRLPDSNVFIDQVIVNGNKIDSPVTNEFYFDAKTSDISFNLGFSAWCDKENVYLQYAISPYTNKWQKIDAQHPVIRINNLPSGSYVLYIRKFTGFGPGNYVTTTYNFEIQAPWYMRWWGQALLLLLFAMIVTIAAIIANRSSIQRQIRLRNLLDKKTAEILKQNEKLEKNDVIKTRLISIISHDIITPLKFLHMTSKFLSERKASMSENMQSETLEEVVNTARELELLSTNILNWIKYQNEERRIVKEKVNVHDLVEQIFTILRSLAHKNNTELVNAVPDNMEVFQLVDPLKVIIYNLVVNAINFTKQGSITVSCSRPDAYVQIAVTDTGLGMTSTQINNLKSDMVIISGTNVNKRSGHGLGFLIIKDLLKMINGEFDIESKLNAGTRVSITFPAK